MASISELSCPTVMERGPREARYWGDGSGVHAHPALTGDVNGDGLMDIVFVGQNWSGGGLNIRTKLSNGNGTWTSRSQVLGDGSGVHTHSALTGDVNGDGHMDIVFVGQNWSGGGLNIRTKLSNGNGTWISQSQVLGDGLWRPYPFSFDRRRQW